MFTAVLKGIRPRGWNRNDAEAKTYEGKTVKVLEPADGWVSVRIPSKEDFPGIELDEESEGFSAELITEKKFQGWNNEDFDIGVNTANGDLIVFDRKISVTPSDPYSPRMSYYRDGNKRGEILTIKSIGVKSDRLGDQIEVKAIQVTTPLDAIKLKKGEAQEICEGITNFARNVTNRRFCFIGGQEGYWKALKLKQWDIARLVRNCRGVVTTKDKTHGRRADGPLYHIVGTKNFKKQNAEFVVELREARAEGLKKLKKGQWDYRRVTIIDAKDFHNMFEDPNFTRKLAKEWERD